MTLPRLLSTLDVADSLGVPVLTVTKAIRQGALPAVKLGRGWRVAERDVEKWVQSLPSNARAVELAGGAR